MPGQHLSELPEVEIFCDCALPKPDVMHIVVTRKPLVIFEIIHTTTTMHFALVNPDARPIPFTCQSV